MWNFVKAEKYSYQETLENSGLSITLEDSTSRAFQAVLVVKNPHANAGDVRDEGSISGSGRSPGGGHGNPRQYSCLENPMKTGAWQATVHSVAQSWT